MRPHQLTVTAMGPYAGTATVDFDDLATEGLFLICGPTGSGKTSLLDALCFALYGEVPGRRDERALKSDHAGPDVTPEASLTFTAQGSRYRIVRQPFHTSLKKRGPGLTERQPTATLQRLDSSGARTVATKLKEVRLEVERLVGLTPAEFQQVILLPQGKFQAVLQGQPEQREALLKTLFDTSGFERMADWLADEAKQRRAEVTTAQQECARLGTEARRVGGVLSLAPNGVETADALFPPDDRGVPDQTGLERLVEQAGERLAEAHKALGEAQQEVERTQNELDGRRDGANQWDARAACVASQARLRGETEAVEAARLRLGEAVAAAHLGPSLDDAAERAEAQHTAALAADRAATQVRAALASAPFLPSVLAPGEQPELTEPDRIADARRQVSVASASLESLRAVAAHGVEAAAQAASVRSAIDEDDRERLASEHEGVRLTEQLGVLDERIRLSASAADRLPGLAEAARTLRNQARAASRLAEARSQLEAARTQHRAAVDRAQGAKAAALDLRQRRLDQIAAELAGRLDGGEACMVCGSVDHPEPARPSGATATAEEVDAAEQTADALAAAATRLDGEVSDHARVEATLLVEAGPAGTDPGAAGRSAEAAETDHEQAEARAAELDRYRARAAELRRQLAENEAECTTIGARLHTARTEAERLQRAAEDARTQVEVSTGAGVTLDAAQAGLGLLDSALASAAAATDERATATGLAAAAADRLSVDLAPSPFTRAEQAHRAALTEHERTILADRIAAHDQELTVVLDKLDDPVWAALRAERPDVDDATAVVRQARHQAEAAVAWRTNLHGAHERLDQLASEHRALRRALVTAEEDAALYEAVANRCGGKVAPKISLQRWVLAAYLESICEHANQRLTAMTSGRYRLLVTRQGATAAARAGLDLWVHDAHTGTERPVSSLSGGETFQASLALALGVADSIQARSGGIRLDVLFVDEGFGSLDPEALALAMDELDDLRAGGRMVGLISHVGTMRERIHHGIEITATAEGSTLSVGRLDAA